MLLSQLPIEKGFVNRSRNGNRNEQIEGTFKAHPVKLETLLPRFPFELWFWFLHIYLPVLLI